MVDTDPVDTCLDPVVDIAVARPCPLVVPSVRLPSVVPHGRMMRRMMCLISIAPLLVTFVAPHSMMNCFMLMTLRLNQTFFKFFIYLSIN